MITTENRCNGCKDIGLPCMGAICTNRNVTVKICDKCGKEVDTLRDYDGEELCENCLLAKFNEIVA